MVTFRERLKWELYCRKRYYLIIYGLNRGLVKPYTEDAKTMERFRNTYYGGVPLSIMLLCLGWTSGKCYDKALTVAYAFHDCKDVRMVDADTQGITLNPANIEAFRKEWGYLPEHYGNHCFIEVTDKNGVTWVYDTTDGLIIEKSLYYKIEKPVITKINDKQAILEYIEYQEMLEQDFEHDKYFLHTIMPMIEMMAKKAKENNSLYSEELQNEIDSFKARIGYDELCKEIEEDKRAKGII